MIRITTGTRRGLERMDDDLEHLRIALVGAGRVGTAVAALLQARGHAIVGVSSRSEASARAAADRLDSQVVPITSWPDHDVVLIGVPDGAIEPVSRSLPSVAAPTVAVHFAGSLGLAPLRPAADRGYALCALHPMQACPDVDTALRRLPGSAWGVTCSEGLERWAQRLVAEHLDGVPVPVAESDRPRWHAAAALTSNGMAALMATGESLLRPIGVERPERVLGPLAAGTVANAVEGGGGGATLTGPVVRGEAETLQRHLEVLDDEEAAAYGLVSLLILGAARSAGRISEEAFRALSDRLDH
jgi:predicted short-subunit dehydrogenase-like oxidoreductase (DUF2520 family)